MIFISFDRGVAIPTRTAVREEAVAQAGNYSRLQTCRNVANISMGKKGVVVPRSMVNLGVAQMDKPASVSPNVTVLVTLPAQMKTFVVRLEMFALVTQPQMNPCVAIPMRRQARQCHFPPAGALPSSSRFLTGPGASPTEMHSRTTGTIQTPPATGAGAALSQSSSTANVGAIAGGTVAGVVVLVAMLVFLIFWRRKQSSGGADSEKPPDGPGVGTSHNHAYTPDAIPPNPGTVDPFLTPMNQHPNPGVSYFGGLMDRPASGAGSGAGSAPQYTGLPEPQHGDDLGPAVGTSTMPIPRHSIHHPYPLPMSVTPLRESIADSDTPRTWSGFGSRPSSGQNTAYGGGGVPYQSPSGWSNHETTNPGSAYSNPPGTTNSYASTPPPRVPSTVYQLSEGGEYNGNRSIYSPPASPPPESLYPRSFAGDFGGLPGGAAPPVTNFTPTEKSLY
ncbi:unnamed protein product [Rhizoctonia solani]|uniref:Transmembrane protein n=1 Tax=Rhizoctonia solani TaxID=456999 RepID=A0A8H3AVD7_9AGAM|nr:unnamed protein product [Rhizoctonia solani]